MSTLRGLRLIWFVTWFNVRMLLTSEFFILTTFLTPLIFATLAFFLFQAGGATEGQTLLYVALGSGMMGVWSTTLFGCGGAIAWQRWEGTLELLVNAPSRYDYILAGQTFGASAADALRFAVASLPWLPVAAIGLLLVRVLWRLRRRRRARIGRVHAWSGTHQSSAISWRTTVLPPGRTK